MPGAGEAPRSRDWQSDRERQIAPAAQERVEQVPGKSSGGARRMDRTAIRVRASPRAGQVTGRGKVQLQHSCCVLPAANSAAGVPGPIGPLTFVLRFIACISVLQDYYYFFFAVLRAVFLAALAFTVFFAAFLAGFFAAFFIAISRLSSSSVGSGCPVKACRNASHSRSLFVACLRLFTWRRVRSSERSLRT